MKLLCHLVGLLIVGLVVVPSTFADISLKLKQQQQYLPPAGPGRNSAVSDQQKFEESKYANSKYQVFEVHNQFDSAAGQPSENKATTNIINNNNNNNNNNNYNNNNNGHSHSEEIRIEHINAPPGFPLDDPNLDATLLNVAEEDGDSDQQTIVKDEIETTSSTNDNFPVPFPSSYRHEFPEKSEPKPVEYVEVQEEYQSDGQTQNIDSTSQYQGQEQYQQQQVDTIPATDYSSSGVGLSQGQQYSQQVFENSFKGSDYLPPTSEGRNIEEAPFKGSDYLPPQQTSGAQAKPFKGSPYLPPIPGSNGDSNPFKGPDYLPPHGSGSGQQSRETINSNNPFKGPDYLPPHQRGSAQLSQEITNSNNPFKGPEYLPPQSSTSTQDSFKPSNPFKGPDYLPPYPKNAGQQSYKPNNSFKGPDYLPPHAGGSAQQTFRPNSVYKGPDYLPPIGNQPHRHHQHPVNGGAFKAPGYLPPGYDFQKPFNSEEAIAELHTLPEPSPIQQYPQEVNVQSHIQVGGSQQSSNVVYGVQQHGTGPQAPGSSYQAPGYLPPSGYSEHNVHSQELSNSIPTQQGGSSAYQAPGYLPPSYSVGNTATSGQPAGREGKSYSAPGYLPPGYDFQKPPGSEQGQNYQAAAPQTSGQHVSTQSYAQQQSYTQGQVSHGSSQTFQGQQQNFVQQQTFNAPGYLPPTNAPHPGTASFKGPDYLPPTGPQPIGQAFKAPDYLPPTAGPQSGNAGQQSFQGPGYLPPTSGSPAFKGPDYLPPQTAPGRQPISTYQAPGYLPPIAATQAPLQHQPSYMHPLSSYMTSVQPYERYGSTRKPFPQYGPPPTQNLPFFPANEVAPMYKEPASRPQYYAPAMSYAQNAVSTQAYSSYTQQGFTAPTLNQQARQALQTFMPKDIRQDITPPRAHVANIASPTASTTAAVVGPTVHTSGPASAKIRTVQIVNPNTVKTLKVLESLDHAGVKTIKILGTTNEEPTGEHRVVKVVSGHEQTVQTVKIFNDHQDVTQDANTSTNTNGYLPPRQKRNPKKTNGRGRRRIAGN